MLIFFFFYNWYDFLCYVLIRLLFVLNTLLFYLSPFCENTIQTLIPRLATEKKWLDPKQRLPPDRCYIFMLNLLFMCFLYICIITLFLFFFIFLNTQLRHNIIARYLSFSSTLLGKILDKITYVALAPKYNSESTCIMQIRKKDDTTSTQTRE